MVRGDVHTQVVTDNGKRPFGGGWVLHWGVIVVTNWHYRKIMKGSHQKRNIITNINDEQLSENFPAPYSASKLSAAKCNEHHLSDCCTQYIKVSLKGTMNFFMNLYKGLGTHRWVS